MHSDDGGEPGEGGGGEEPCNTQMMTGEPGEGGEWKLTPKQGGACSSAHPNGR